MCGITAYKGKGRVVPLLIEGLQRLEYRGYDSAGIAYCAGGVIKTEKTVGKVSSLVSALEGRKIPSGGMGMGHTRWATHGAPSRKNAHPHFSHEGRLAIVHNGVVENYSELKEKLSAVGCVFRSDTDTEVLASLIEHKWAPSIPLDEATRLALREVVGAYAVIVMAAEELDTLVLARRGSSLLVGKGEDGSFFAASDAAAIVAHTRDILYLEDGEIATIREDELGVKGLNNRAVTRESRTVDVSIEELSKGAYGHFMLKEIYAQPHAIIKCMRGRVREGCVYLGGISDHARTFCRADRIILIGCGTSWHAALLGEYIIESLCGVPVEVEYASEFRYRDPIIRGGDVVVVLSQSGETADTAAAAELSKRRGATVIGIVNGVASTIARITDAGIYLRAGLEIGVASTKTFTAQLTVLIMLALWIREQRNVRKADDHARALIQDLMLIPQRIEETLKEQKSIIKVAEAFQESRNFLYLGRGYNFPVALEGALKLKEISHIHAEGYPAAEMKHGPIALIDEDMPVVCVATRGSSYRKIVSNVQEVKARKGRVIAILSEEDPLMRSLADYVIKVPKCHEVAMPILTVLPLQLLAYHIALLQGRDIDKPRNLAKSVTVE